MPHESFFKLEEEKRKKILEAIEKEFGSNTFEKASVNKIVEEAGISKGSFWFYFENKEDAIEYIIENHIEMEKELAIKLLKENNGDIFQTYISIFDFLLQYQPEKEKRELIPNICKNLIINHRENFEKAKLPPRIEAKLIQDEEFLNLLQKDLLEKNKKELFVLLKHLNYALRTNLVDCLTESIDKKTAKENLLNEIEILKGGICQNA